MATPGKVETHHCAVSSRPSATIALHSRVGGTAQGPGNDSAAVVMMAAPKSMAMRTKDVAHGAGHTRYKYTPRLAPPSTVMAIPVMKLARSDARNVTRSATSRGRPMRPKGLTERPASSRPDSSLAVGPGLTAGHEDVVGCT